jgi:hypothetical protein
MSRSNPVGMALGYGLEDRGSRFRFSAGAGNCIQNGCEAHPASYPTGTRGSFSGRKAAWAWSWTPPSSAEVKVCVEIYLNSPICLHAVVLSSAQGQLYFSLLYITASKQDTCISGYSDWASRNTTFGEIHSGWPPTSKRRVYEIPDFFFPVAMSLVPF